MIYIFSDYDVLHVVMFSFVSIYKYVYIANILMPMKDVKTEMTPPRRRGGCG